MTIRMGRILMEKRNTTTSTHPVEESMNLPLKLRIPPGNTSMMIRMHTGKMATRMRARRDLPIMHTTARG